MTSSDSAPRGSSWFLDSCFALWFGALFLRLQGLPLGVGNQSLHLAWIRHLRNPDLFAADPLIHSFNHFPSLFFQIFARLIPPGVSPETALQVCQAVNTCLLFLGCIRLARTLFPSAKGAWAVPLFFLFEPTRALAETPLPPVAFSHTALGLTLAVFALNAVFKDRLRTAALLFGLLMNIHLLTAAYAGAIAAATLAFTLRSRPWRSLLVPVSIGALLSLPVLAMLLAGGGSEYNNQWLQLLRERSAHHVFPSAWWRPGDPVIGTYVLALGWLPVLLALTPRDRLSPARMMMWLIPLLLMLLGAFGAFILPHPLLLRAQLFRASLFPLLLVFVSAPAAAERLLHVLHPRWVGVLVVVGIGAGFFLPSLQTAQPWLLLSAGVLLWGLGRLRARHAWAVLPVFPVLALSDRMLNTSFLSPSLPSVPDLTLLALLGGSLLLGVASIFPHRRIVGGLVLLGGLAVALPIPHLPVNSSHPDPWTDIQNLTRLHTPEDAVVLTPVRRAGFRDQAHRSIVGEWRDGTMQFFDPAFAQDWSTRMIDLSPERTERFTADDWVAAGQRYGAAYAVLPVDQARGLIPVAENHEWVLARTERVPPPPLPDPPSNAVDPADWLAQEQFVREVVKPNILRHRVRTVDLRLEDIDGRPLSGIPLQIKQTRLAFGIGSALHHFHEVSKQQKGFNAPINHPRELELFAELFNFSVIGYSGKWMYLEPEPGQRTYEDLDAYVDWCVKHNIRIQYHFVTGYEPGWLRKKPAGFRKTALMIHAGELIDRYGDRIDEWQIINERRMQNGAPDVFALFRERQPGDRLGVSHCARFYTPRKGEKGQMDLKRGWRSMQQIQQAGQKVDFFSIHAHRPFGVLSDPRTMYAVLDDFQEEGIRVNVSETGIPHSGPIEGTVLSGEWTPDLQARELVRYIEILYSHPNVDGVNFWGFGPETWQKDIGLLDENFEPLPAYTALKTLVKETWASRADGRSGHNGRFQFTGHRGEYQVILRHPDGREGRGTFELNEEPDAVVPVSIRWQD